VSFFQLDGTWLGLFDRSALAEDIGLAPVPSGFSGITLSHNVSSEAAVDQALTKRPQKAAWGGYHGYFSDPDGYHWEVAYNPFLWIGPLEREK
jgi:uncharacterized glyoxalase superfamily protein PhnB